MSSDGLYEQRPLQKNAPRHDKGPGAFSASVLFELFDFAHAREKTLLYITDFGIDEDDLHVFIDINLLGPKVDNFVWISK